ncbi:MAG: 50S ribosomal protein L29 [Planctomycetes bacterium DG_23]|nr:MAG: 50S ribosomal protein L29 [Planctomycetes bacterium DG_23]
MKAKELRQMSDSEVAEELARLEEEIFRLRFRKTSQELENPREIGRVKRDIARIKTIMREREIAAKEK